MAKLIKCRICGASISSSAKICPQCGAKNKKPLYKRWWLWIILVILALTLVPKGDSDDKSQKNSGDDNTSTNQVSGSTPISNNDSFPDIIIEKQVIYDNNDVVITANGLERSGKDWNVNLLIENNSSLNLGFNAHAYAINGIMTRNNIYDMDCDVAAGKKANTQLSLKGSLLEKYGIREIRCIDCLFWAYDNDKSFKEFDTNQIEIKTNLYNAEHDRISGTTIYNDGKINVDYLGANGNDYNFCLTNTTDSHLTFDFDNITINDFTSSDTDYDLFDEALLNNCQIVCTITVRDDFMKANGLSDVSTIEWSMSIRMFGSHFNEYSVGPIICNVK